MTKRKMRFFLITLLLLLAGCGKAEREGLTVYSFSGENDRITVFNGVIVLNGEEGTFYGGNLKAEGEEFSDIVSRSTKFYVLSGDGENAICSDRVEDTSGGTIQVSGDLGKLSGDILGRLKTDDENDLKNSLFFELVATDRSGETCTYQLQMILKEVTREASE